jgi:hypothetical protein
MSSALHGKRINNVQEAIATTHQRAERVKLHAYDWRHASVISTRQTRVDHLRRMEITGYKTLFIVRLDSFFAADALKQAAKQDK